MSGREISLKFRLCPGSPECALSEKPYDARSNERDDFGVPQDGTKLHTCREFDSIVMGVEEAGGRGVLHAETSSQPAASDVGASEREAILREGDPPESSNKLSCLLLSCGLMRRPALKPKKRKLGMLHG
jgi:hypothetical protein